LDDTYILAAGSGSWKWELEVGKRSPPKKIAWDSETGFLFSMPQLTLISLKETRFLCRGLRNRVAFFGATVNFNIPKRNPVSWLGVKCDRAMDDYVGFISKGKTVRRSRFRKIDI
jgi:hypothetical protein